MTVEPLKCGTIIADFFATKNFGFVRDDETQKDFFLHVGGFTDKIALPKGTRVWFHTQLNPKHPGKWSAVDVHAVQP